MQAVILAAGRGTRIGVLTSIMPKPLLTVAGKRLLEHKMDAFPDSIDEIIIVIGYLGHLIQEHFGDAYRGKKIVYKEQGNTVGGTMDALSQARPFLRGTFLATNADDIHRMEDIEACIREPWALAVMHLDELDAASRIEIDAGGAITDIVEANMHDGGPGLGGVGLYVLDERIFDVAPVRLPGRTETGLPQTMLSAARACNITLNAVSVSFRVHITNADDLTRAEVSLSGGKK